jgi:putative RecB family exonuclease
MTTLLAPRPAESRATATNRDYISYSAISTYQQCPLKFYFKYVAGLPEVTVSSSLVLGGAIHSAAEFHFNELMIGNPAPDHDTLLAVFWDEWRDRGEEAEIRLGKKEDINTVGKMADRILTAFVESDIAKPEGRILGIEEQLRGELIPGVPDLLARIDLIVETDETLTVTDLKTSRSRWSANQADDSGEQLLLYSELARHLAPDKTLRLEFAVVTKTAKPTVERWTVANNANRIARTKQIIRRVWKSIESGNFFPAPSPISCGGCPFRKPCRAWQ